MFSVFLYGATVKNRALLLRIFKSRLNKMRQRKTLSLLSFNNVLSIFFAVLSDFYPDSFFDASGMEIDYKRTER